MLNLPVKALMLLKQNPDGVFGLQWHML